MDFILCFWELQYIWLYGCSYKVHTVHVNRVLAAASCPAVFWMACFDLRWPVEKDGFWTGVYCIDTFWTASKESKGHLSLFLKVFFIILVFLVALIGHQQNNYHEQNIYFDIHNHTAQECIAHLSICLNHRIMLGGVHIFNNGRHPL